MVATKEDLKAAPGLVASDWRADAAGDVGVRIGLRRSRLGASAQELDPSNPILGRDFQETYRWIAGRAHGPPTDRFNAHVLASIFTVALIETDWGHTSPLTEAIGLGFDEAIDTIIDHFPHTLVEIGSTLGDWPVERSDDEADLHDLLWRSLINPDALAGRLAKILTRRAQRPNLLWQDLGLRSRGELSTLMNRHFPELARRNGRDFRWKVYFRRSTHRDPNYTLCTTLSCLECDDFFACFGEGSAEELSLASANRGSLL